MHSWVSQLRPAQDPVIPLLIGGLVAVLILAALSVLAWVWAMRRPPSPPQNDSEASISGERPPLIYVAVGAQTGLGLDNDAGSGSNWVDLLRERMPEGTRLITLGRRGITLAELNQTEIPATVEDKPDIITLWSAVSDTTKSVVLPDYIKELNRALTALIRGTQAPILLLNLPDISLVAYDAPDDRKALIRGGVVQWNQAIVDAIPRYGRRVRLVDIFPISEQILVSREGEEPEEMTGNERNAVLADLVWQVIEKEHLLEGT